MTEYFYKGTNPIPIGGHKINVGGPIAYYFKYSDGLPLSSTESTVKSISNGHVQYKNLYFKRQVGQTGGIEIPLGSGNFYKKKPTHTIINPHWNDQKIAEEIAIAQANKTLNGLPKVDLDPLPGYSQSRVEWKYTSNFSDGTPVEIIIRSTEEAWIKNVITGEFAPTIKSMHTAIIMINP